MASSTSSWAGRRSCEESGDAGFCVVLCRDGRGRIRDARQSPVSCLDSCCSASKLLLQKLSVTGSMAHTNVFTEQIKAGEKKGKASKWLWVFFEW